jgi:hypothetical protein
MAAARSVSTSRTGHRPRAAAAGGGRGRRRVEEHPADALAAHSRGDEQAGHHGQLLLGPAKGGRGQFHGGREATRNQGDVAGDISVLVGDPAAVRVGRGQERRYVRRQEARVAVCGVDLANQFGAGGEVLVAARADQHLGILSRQPAAASGA